MTAETVSRWSRRFVAAGALALVAWAVAAVLGLGRRTEVWLALYGLVLLTVFGKAYALVPTYFDRTLAVPRAPAVQFPLSVGGVGALTLDSLGPAWPAPDWLGQVGALAWAGGVVVFLAALGWTLRDNPTGAETGTGEHNADRRPVDRAANAVVPLALCYLLVVTAALAARGLGVALPLNLIAVSHLLGAGVATLVLLGVGFRLFPRLLVAHPPKLLVWAVLPAGVLGPALLVVGLSTPAVLPFAWVVEGVAIAGFSVAYLVLAARTERTRVGVYAGIGAALGGLGAVVVAGHLALAGRTAALVTLHFRLALVGFLGLAVVAASMQFYPPAVGKFPGSTDRTALVAVALLAGGLALQVGGLAVPQLTAAGEWAVLLGTLGYAYLLASAFSAR